MAEKIKVTAGPGRTVPMDPNIARGVNGRILLLREGDVIEVDPANTHVIRAMNDGDLVVVKADAPAPSSAPLKAEPRAPSFAPPKEL